jgi:hypothetical protein
MMQLNSGITALETRYAGYRFRSRIEARWAVFFTRLGLDWEYEQQGYLVGRPTQSEPLPSSSWVDPISAGSGARGYVRPEHRTKPYLPDFYLPKLALYVEVKPAAADQIDPDGVRRWEDFAGMVATEWDYGQAALFCGPIPDPDRVDAYGPPRADNWYDPGIVIIGDYHYCWCACPAGKHFGIEFEGRGGRILCGCDRIQDDRYSTGDHPVILNAYAAARSARFEHGEAAA